MNYFSDILEPRRNEFSNFLWVSRNLNTVLAYKQNIRPKPGIHKQEVLSSPRMKEVMEKINKETGISNNLIQETIKLILDEIGFNKQLKVIRWLGLVLTKICQKIYTRIYVNEESIKRLKTVMGTCPVVFVPSHRSYADFIIMSYVCFTYDIEIPTIAAGMDFHAMWGMGSILRNTGAFFMRRSFNDDRLYWETFKQYINQIVTRGDLPIEFFIEGTRSRSCKSLIPKFGLLSMILKPLFTGEVPDVLIVPINISYDRVLEEKLFTFELLGVPKPKESTSGFFKSLSIIKQNYGNIYVDFTSPISAKQYFGDKLERVFHSIGPIHQQELTCDDLQLIEDIGYEILSIQRKNAVLLPFNLIALLLSTNVYSLQSLAVDMMWLRNILENFEARVADEPLEKALLIHKGLVKIENNGSNVQLVRDFVNLDEIDAEKLKGYKLSNELLTNIVPQIMLQLYVNPCLHYFTNCCLIVISIRTFGKSGKINKDELFGYFRFLRTIFSYEFVFYKKRDDMDFEYNLEKLELLKVIENVQNEIVLLNNEKLEALLVNLLNPFIAAYCCLYYILQKKSESCTIEHSHIIIETQKHLEYALQSDANLHPYCLSLDSISVCLQSLVNVGVLKKVKETNKINYEVNMLKLTPISEKLNIIFEKCYKINANKLFSVTSHCFAKL